MLHYDASKFSCSKKIENKFIVSDEKMNENNEFGYEYVKLVAEESEKPCEQIYKVLSFSNRYDNRPSESLMMRIKEVNSLIGNTLTKENTETWSVKLEEFVNKYFL